MTRRHTEQGTADHPEQPAATMADNPPSRPTGPHHLPDGMPSRSRPSPAATTRHM
ncbi:hypothetical protein [Nonomuraea helvata]|uniref:Uncharacterized protein n=1 Tax=Nonomuraea helvata TaxID=37484 RepID=A0ABV5SEA6_9ACTN